MQPCQINCIVHCLGVVKPTDLEAVAIKGYTYQHSLCRKCRLITYYTCRSVQGIVGEIRLSLPDPDPAFELVGCRAAPVVLPAALPGPMGKCPGVRSDSILPLRGFKSPYPRVCERDLETWVREGSFVTLFEFWVRKMILAKMLCGQAPSVDVVSVEWR